MILSHLIRPSRVLLYTLKTCLFFPLYPDKTPWTPPHSQVSRKESGGTLRGLGLSRCDLFRIHRPLGTLTKATRTTLSVSYTPVHRPSSWTSSCHLSVVPVESVHDPKTWSPVVRGQEYQSSRSRRWEIG